MHSLPATVLGPIQPLDPLAAPFFIRCPQTMMQASAHSHMWQVQQLQMQARARCQTRMQQPLQQRQQMTWHPCRMRQALLDPA